MENWRQFSDYLAARFENRGGVLDARLIRQAAEATSADIVRKACVKHAVRLAEARRIELESDWQRIDLVEKITRILKLVDPLINVCIEVDSSLGGSRKAENEFISRAENLFLTKELIQELSTWAESDLAEANDGQSNHEGRFLLIKSLKRLRWLQRVEVCFTECCYDVIREYIKTTCAMQFEEPMLDDMLEWGNSIPAPWLASMIEDPVQRETALRRLEFCIHDAFGDLRSAEFFDIIASFPSSAAAVDDYKLCLERTHSQATLVSRVSEALSRRLLHGGATTPSILIGFIRLIKTMRHLDPRGLLLDAVAEPVKAYLRSRPETIRCIVTALTNDAVNESSGSNLELYEELGLDMSTNIQPIDLDAGDADDELDVWIGGEKSQDPEDDDQDVTLDPNTGLPIVKPVTARDVFQLAPSSEQKLALMRVDNWEPDPIEALSVNTKVSSARASNDILSHLVRVYGSKELFVNEYRHLLADRLLGRSLDTNIDSEVARLELLKLRFGEAALVSCDVMLKDVQDARRTRQHLPSHKEVEPMIVSKHNWPQLSSERSLDTDFSLHRTVKQRLDTIGREYAKYKKPRRVVWAQHLGAVDLDVTFPDSTVKSFTNLTPLQTSIILHFTDSSQWTLADLASALQVNLEVLRKRIAFWVAEAVLIEDRGSSEEFSQRTYTIANTAPQFGDELAEDVEEEEEESQIIMEEENDEGVRNKVLVDFIVGMLTNLGANSAEAIHRNLTMFSAALPTGYDKSEDELRVLLEDCSAKGILEKTADDKYSAASSDD